MNNTRTYFNHHLKTARTILLGYIVFAGCFSFPFGNILFPFDLSKAFIIVASYGAVALGYAVFYGETRTGFVYVSSFSLTIIGMIFRYIIEYGEYSNTINFTSLNILLYLSVIPLFLTVSYHYLAANLYKKSI